jgi:hypothetical protein
MAAERSAASLASALRIEAWLLDRVPHERLERGDVERFAHHGAGPMGQCLRLAFRRPMCRHQDDVARRTQPERLVEQTQVGAVGQVQVEQDDVDRQTRIGEQPAGRRRVAGFVYRQSRIA